MALGGIAAFGEDVAKPQTRQGPNVLVIVTDDQRAGLPVMPNLRRYLRNGGTSFKPAFVTTPVCCPSRASIMTGRYAHNHGVKSNSSEGESGADVLDHSTTLQANLNGAGYRTGIIGKFLNPPWRLADNPPHFDEWMTLGGEESNSQWFGANYNANGTVKEIPGYTTTVIRRKAKRFILRNGVDDRPWYLYVATKAPHLPAPPQPSDADYPVERWEGNPAVREVDESDKPLYVQENSRGLKWANRARRAQLRSLVAVDRMIEKLVTAIKDTGENRNTIVVFTSDNGYMWSEHGLKGKSVPYRQALSVPLLFRWPGHLERGHIDTRLAANIDIAPTILDAADVAPSSPQDGRSLLKSWTRDRLHTESWCNANILYCNRWASTWTHSYAYTEYHDEGRVIFREYYDLERDSWQLHNLLGDQDPTNDPATGLLETQLHADQQCEGASCP